MNRLINFLEPFAEVNSRYGVSNDYDFTLISHDLKDTEISAMSKYVIKNKEDKISLFPLDDWESEMLSEYEKYWFGLIPQNFELEDLSPRKYLIKLLKDFFCGSNFEVTRVEVRTYRYYACCAEEYILKTNSKIYLLSLQVHD